MPSIGLATEGFKLRSCDGTSMRPRTQQHGGAVSQPPKNVPPFRHPDPSGARGRISRAFEMVVRSFTAFRMTKRFNQLLALASDCTSFSRFSISSIFAASSRCVFGP